MRDRGQEIPVGWYGLKSFHGRREALAGMEIK